MANGSQRGPLDCGNDGRRSVQKLPPKRSDHRISERDMRSGNHFKFSLEAVRLEEDRISCATVSDKIIQF